LISKGLRFTIATENFLGCSGRIPPSPPALFRFS
jgi:hypothetical protein